MEATPSLSSQISLPSFLLLFYDVMRIRIMCCIPHVNIRECKCEWFIRDSATFCVVQLYTIISKTVFRFWLPRSSGLMFFRQLPIIQDLSPCEYTSSLCGHWCIVILLPCIKSAFSPRFYNPVTQYCKIYIIIRKLVIQLMTKGHWLS